MLSQSTTEVISHNSSHVKAPFTVMVHVTLCLKRFGQEKKKDVTLTGKADIKNAELLAVGETCMAISMMVIVNL